MQRSSIIATVIAAGGILIAGSVASVAVINAASSNQPDSQTIQLVAAGATATASPEATPSSEATASTGTEQAAAVAALPSLDSSSLPALPKVSDTPSQQAAGQVKPATSSTKPSASSSDDDSAAASVAQRSTLSADKARAIVLKQGDGVSVVSTSKESHQGYSTWAVRITRSNGEVLTGYVDRESGVVVDWTVNQQAQAAKPSPTASSDDDDSSDDESSGSSDDHSGSGSDDSSESGHDSDDD